jgi:hypothetical protein
VPKLPTRTTSAKIANPTVHGGTDSIYSGSCEEIPQLILGRLAIANHSIIFVTVRTYINQITASGLMAQWQGA